MDQLGFAFRDPYARHDPPTSRAAVERMKVTGALAGKRAETLRALARYVGAPPTSHELAGDNADLRYSYAKRLPELRDRGFVVQAHERECTITKRRAVTWRLTIKGCQALRTLPVDGPIEDTEHEEEG